MLGRRIQCGVMDEHGTPEGAPWSRYSHMRSKYKATAILWFVTITIAIDRVFMALSGGSE